MKNKTHPKNVQYGIAFSLLLLATLSQAATTVVSPSQYSVTEGVAFALGNSGTGSFLFGWTDPTGAPPSSFSGVVDPTLILTIGQTYTFQRTTSAHPFAIMNNMAAGFISGSDGSFNRTTTNSVLITAATLTPIADFTADPAAAPPTPGPDKITWTPNLAGDFWYTCTVTSHTGMTGKITVVPEPSAFGLIVGGLAVGVLRRRRGFGSNQ